MSYEITRRQTTFWDFTGQTGVTRVHFDGKREWAFSDSYVPSFAVETNHPVLVNYMHPWLHIFTASPAVNPDATLRRVDDAVRDATEGWRSLVTYRAENDALNVLSTVCGSLLSAPAPVIGAVSTVLASECIAFTTAVAHSALGPLQALVAGRSWVIAASFRIEALPLNKPLRNDARQKARAS